MIIIIIIIKSTSQVKKRKEKSNPSKNFHLYTVSAVHDHRLKFPNGTEPCCLQDGVVTFMCVALETVQSPKAQCFGFTEQHHMLHIQANHNRTHQRGSPQSVRTDTGGTNVGSRDRTHPSVLSPTAPAACHVSVRYLSVLPFPAVPQ